MVLASVTHLAAALTTSVSWSLTLKRGREQRIADLLHNADTQVNLSSPQAMI